MTSIEAVRRSYLETDLRKRLAKYHDDVDSAFWGWNGIWLDPRFRDWNIEAELDRIMCPVLAIQGHDDEHGTLAQVHEIRRRPMDAPRGAEDCRHSPHRDQPERLIDSVLQFMEATSPSAIPR